MKKENNVTPHFEELEERLEMANAASSDVIRCASVEQVPSTPGRP